jgi:thioredoxin-like negative regulator of GroEL
VGNENEIGFPISLVKIVGLFLTQRFPTHKQVIKPIYKELSQEHTDVAMGTVDIDEEQDAAMEFQISAVPTFVFFDGETAVNKLAGADANQLKALIEDLKKR